MPDEEEPKLTEHVRCPICGGRIPTARMEVRFIARYTCPTCKNDVLIEGDQLQA